jgi:hypothetical protein
MKYNNTIEIIQNTKYIFKLKYKYNMIQYKTIQYNTQQICNQNNKHQIKSMQSKQSYQTTTHNQIKQLQTITITI